MLLNFFAIRCWYLLHLHKFRQNALIWVFMQTILESLCTFIKYGQSISWLNYLQFHNALYGDAKGWAKRFCSFLLSYIPGVMNPHARVIQKWNKFFVITCLISIFVDPLFFFVLSVLDVTFFLLPFYSTSFPFFYASFTHLHL